MSDTPNENALEALRVAIVGEQEKLLSSHAKFAEHIEKAQKTLSNLAREVDDQQSNVGIWRETAMARLGAAEAMLGEYAQQGEAGARLPELEAELEEAKAALAKAQEQTTRLEAKLNDESGAAEGARRRVAELEGELKQRVSAIEDAQAGMKPLEEEIAALRARAEEAEAACERGKEARDAAKEEAETLRTDLAAACEARDAAFAEHAGAGEELAALGARVESLEAAAREAEEALAAARQEIEAVQPRLEETKKHLEAEQQKAAEAAAECDRLRARIATLPNPEQVDELTAMLHAERDRVKALQEELGEEKAKGTKSALAEQLAAAIKDAEELRGELRAARQELEKSRGRSAGNGGDTPATAPAIKASPGPKRTLGRILCEAGALSEAQVEEALDAQRRTPQRHLGAILVEKAFVNEETVAQALACQCNADFVRILDDKDVDAEATALISKRLAQQHACIPIRTAAGRLTLAMVNPMDLVAIEDVERTTSREVEIAVGTASDIKEAIERYYWEPE